MAGYFTSDDVIERHPELVEDFAAAMKESQEYAQAHPEETRAVLSECTKVAPEVLEALVLPRFPGEIDTTSTERILELSRESGIRATRWPSRTSSTRVTDGRSDGAAWMRRPDVRAR